jgi:DNA-binding transcriptional MerR regulator
MRVLLHIAAQELGLSPRTLDQWARTGRIKFKRSTGGWRMFDSTEIARVKIKLTKRAGR